MRVFVVLELQLGLVGVRILVKISVGIRVRVVGVRVLEEWPYRNRREEQARVARVVYTAYVQN